MTNDQGLKSNLVALDQAHAFDDDRVERRAAVAPDRRVADGFDDVHALNDSAKDRVLSVPLRVRRGADEELAGGAVRVVGHARHRNRAGDMLERLRKFALNFLLSRLPHAPGRRVAVDRVGVAALHCDDAVLDLDDAMKLRAVVKMIAHQVLEVGDVLRRVWYELDDDLAIAGVEHRDFIRVFLVTASRDKEDPNEVAVLDTSYGQIVIEFIPDAPKNVANFKNLARDHFYDGTQFHRIVKIENRIVAVQ